jgi:hypothetical protein
MAGRQGLGAEWDMYWQGMQGMQRLCFSSGLPAGGAQLRLKTLRCDCMCNA